MSLSEKEQLIYREFSRVTPDAEPCFAPFFEKNLFGDTTFSLFCAWEDRFRYAYRQWEKTVAVLEHGLEDRLSCILLWEEEAEFRAAAAELYRLFRETGLPLYFEYVRESELPMYLRAAGEIGEGVEVRSFWDSSDYIYERDEFLALEGRRNKGKRGDVNSLMRQYPELHVEFHGAGGRDLREDCLRVFDHWCSAHDCENCVYGCERKAFSRFLELVDEKRFCLAASFAEDEPMSFAACERIGPELDCYHFQKNARPIRGLTYWLNREMALARRSARYINLAEDMGLPGLRQDKMGLHPCRLEAKYTVQFL